MSRELLEKISKVGFGQYIPHDLRNEIAAELAKPVPEPLTYDEIKTIVINHFGSKLVGADFNFAKDIEEAVYKKLGIGGQ